MAGKWSAQESDEPVNTLEMRAVLMALTTFQKGPMVRLQSISS